jgi:hypothetical protein
MAAVPRVVWMPSSVRAQQSGLVEIHTKKWTSGVPRNLMKPACLQLHDLQALSRLHIEAQS